MQLNLNNIKQITYEELVDFFENQREPEGVQLDYKREYPKKGLAKTIVAFANQLGGLIVIGVEEDEKSGVPLKWDGVKKPAKDVERVLQEASYISPHPNIQVATVQSPQNDKSFVLVRVLEGEFPPYYKTNDSNIWVRTGNISRPIDIASPEWVKFLFGKRREAKQEREIRISIAREYYKGGLRLNEERRVSELRLAKQKNDGSEKNFFGKTLGSDVVMCETSLLPSYPSKEIIKASELKDQIQAYRHSGRWDDFPDLNLTPIQDGVMRFDANLSNGAIDCHQVHACGLVYSKLDVMRIEEGRKVVYMSQILSRIYRLLSSASKLYSLAEFTGPLELKIELGDLAGTTICRIVNSNGIFFKSDAEEDSVLDRYSWTFDDINTDTLNSSLEKLLFHITEKIYWDLGFGKLHENVFDSFMKEWGFK